MGNPLVDQGVLNRLVASVQWASYPQLTVTAPFLNKAGIRLALEGEATTILPTLTGTVPSPEPYQPITVTINLLKTQFLSNLYKVQMETLSFIGNGIVYPDVSTGLSPYPINNAGIMAVRELDFSGEDAGWAVSIRGYYLLNSSAWG